jgi:hypothetical protein
MVVEAFRLLYDYAKFAVSTSANFIQAGPDPYSAYSFYSASTPPLPVRQGETVNFQVRYRADTGPETRAVTFQHSMSDCAQSLR